MSSGKAGMVAVVLSTGAVLMGKSKIKRQSLINIYLRFPCPCLFESVESDRPKGWHSTSGKTGSVLDDNCQLRQC